MATEKLIIANQQNLNTVLDLEPDPVNAAQSEMLFATDSRQKRSYILEDPADYKAFERAIKSDYSPQTAIEGQFVTRLASLLWRDSSAIPVRSNRNGFYDLHL